MALSLSSKALEIYLSLKRQHIGKYSSEYLSRSVSIRVIMESATDSQCKIVQGKEANIH